MSDPFTKKERSEVMRAVKSAGNASTEIHLIKLFRQYGLIGWRRNYQIFGKPDFVFPQKHVAVFADGCFWHGHTCRNLSPRQNARYWKQKVVRNRRRDALVCRTLSNNGWVVVRLWECQISKGQISKLNKVLEIRKRN